jgi:peptidoglycan hydrolase-like amidase
MSFRSHNRSRTRRVVALIALSAVLLGATPVSAPAEELAALAPSSVSVLATPPDFIFTGAGFGHGIGMSQYGAQGYAKRGYGYKTILQHYYTGTTVPKLADITTKVKVNLDDAYVNSSYAGRTSWTVRANTVLLTVTSLSGGSPTYLAAGTYWTFTNVPVYDGAVFSHWRIEVRQYGSTGAAFASWGNDVVVAPAASGARLQIRENSGPFDAWGVQYRGDFYLDRMGSSKLTLINRVDMQHYLYGVVPREMPSGWHAEALKVQAVAARSYAYPEVIAGTVLKCTTWSQVYGGYGYTASDGSWRGEQATTNAAIDATDNEVVKYGSSVITTYFSSQSGGHTANVEDVWVPADGDLAAKAAQYPYLRGVPDPYEVEAGAQYVPWPADKQVEIDGAALAGKLRASSLSGVPASPAYVTGIAIEYADSGFARYATFSFSSGGTVKTTGDKVRGILGLLSSKFSVGPPFQRVYGSDRYATAVAAAARAFPGTAPVVVIASGEDYADALSGTGLAGKMGGPLLLTQRGVLPGTVTSALKRLAPADVYLMGGTKVVTPEVEASVKAALPAAKVTRVAGPNRYETAYAAARLIGAADRAFVVNGTAWPDAVCASSLAYATGSPVLLTDGASLHPRVGAYLTEHKPSTLLVGGTAVLAAGVEQAAAKASGSAVTRLWGSDRYATSAAVAHYSIDKLGFDPSEPYFASGSTYPDALSGGSLAGSRKAPLLLTGADHLAPATRTAVRAMPRPDLLWILGGPAAISSTGLAELQAAYP